MKLLTIEPDPGVKVEAWLWPATTRATREDGTSEVTSDSTFPLAVLFHGNAETVEGMADIAEIYQSLGFAVLAPEYRGYGRSLGKPSQSALTTDVVALIDAALADSSIGNVDQSRMLFHGVSIGGGVACSVARERPPAALVLQSTFTSLSSMAWRFGAPPLLVRDPYRNDQTLREFSGKVLLLHGVDDEIIPPSHSRALAALAKNVTHLELPGGHNDFPRDGAQYANAIRAFVEATIATPAHDPDVVGSPR